MTARQPFAPAYGTNQILTAAAASASVTIGKSNQLRITNTGASIGYVRTFTSLTAKPAMATDLPIPAGASIIITKDQAHDSIAYISAAGTTLQVIEGEGW